MNKAAQALGKLGGKAGVGDSKRRSRSHYRRIAKLALEVRRKAGKAANKACKECSSSLVAVQGSSKFYVVICPNCKNAEDVK